MEEKIFSVTDLNNRIKGIIDADSILQNICVKGELSNYKVYPSGHHYFTLKDSESSIRCVMFKGSALKLRFRPESGMGVVVQGKVSVYPRDGAYQLYCSEMSVDGVGDLYVAYEVSGRYDGTSRFKAGQRFGLFPSFSLGWRISHSVGEFLRRTSTLL